MVFFRLKLSNRNIIYVIELGNKDFYFFIIKISVKFIKKFGNFLLDLIHFFEIKNF